MLKELPEVMTMLEHAITNMENRRTTCTVYFYAEKTFDKIWQERLIAKMTRHSPGQYRATEQEAHTGLGEMGSHQGKEESRQDSALSPGCNIYTQKHTYTRTIR